MSAGIITGNIKANHIVALTISPASVAANTTAEQTFTLMRARAYHLPIVSKPTAQAGLGIVGVRVSANDTIAITFSNNTASPIVPTASEVYIFGLFTPEGNVAPTTIGG